jgi:hypothetical protein
MTVSLSPIGQDAQFFDNLGNPLSGGKIFTYQASSFTTLQATYSDPEGTVPNANPIVLDSSGRLTVNIFLDMALSYNIVLTKADGSTVLRSWNNTQGGINAAFLTTQLANLADDFLLLSGGTVTGSLVVQGTTTTQVLNTSSISSSGTITATGSITGQGLNASGQKVTNVLTPTASTDAATKGYVDGSSGSLSLTPIGSIIMWAASSPPANWLVCDGSAISRTTYASLFAVLSTLYGAGDGTTTFNLPDYRGSFLRGLDSGRGLDPARALGNYQADTFASHVHAIQASQDGWSYGRAQGSDRGNDAQFNSEPTGGSETRPKNYSVLFLIRAL